MSSKSTRAQELRSKSVLANKALMEIDESLDKIKKEKSHRNDTSFSAIEKEKARVARAILLPPLQKIKEMEMHNMYKTTVNTDRAIDSAAKH